MFRPVIRGARILTPRRLFWCGIVGGVSLVTFSSFSPVKLDQPQSKLEAAVQETVAVDSSISPFPLKIKPSNIVHKEYTLLGHGVRSVTFLGLKVYGIGIYVGSADIPAIQKVLGNLGPDELKVQFKDAERYAELVSQMIDNKVDFLIRISPVRNTDFGHLGDGFIKSILASTTAKTHREAVGAGLDELRVAFKSFKGSVPKDHLLILETAHGPLEITYHDPKTDTIKRLGLIKEPLISKALLIQYLASKKPLSASLRESCNDGLIGLCK